MRRLPELGRRRLMAWTGPLLAPPSPQELEELRPHLDEDTFARVAEPSFSGRIMYRLAHKFFYQWSSLKQFYPKATCCGPLV